MRDARGRAALPCVPVVRAWSRPNGIRVTDYTTVFVPTEMFKEWRETLDIESVGCGAYRVRAEPPKPRSEPEPWVGQSIFEAWLSIAEPKSRELTASRKRTIDRALKEQPVELCLRALRGMVTWHSKRGGNLELSRVFGGRPNGSPLGEQIEWFASLAQEDSDGLEAFGPQARERAKRLRGDVARFLQAPSEANRGRYNDALRELHQMELEAVATANGKGVELRPLSSALDPLVEL